MQRSELEHVIRASGDIAQDNEIIVIGSQSILGQFPNAPARLLARDEPESAPILAGNVVWILWSLRPSAQDFRSLCAAMQVPLRFSARPGSALPGYVHRGFCGRSSD